jgi:Uma2 family endonuclease
MQLAPELGIPEVKPAIESIHGRWFQKMSPRRRHSLVQGRMYALLATWAGDRGDVGPEWRFYLVPEAGKPSSLVPDVAYLSAARLPEIEEARERPVLAPDIAVEVLSPGDRKRLLETKIALYFAYGSRLVIVVDPATRTVRMVEGDHDRTWREGDRAESAAFPDLAIDVAVLFARL